MDSTGVQEVLRVVFDQFARAGRHALSKRQILKTVYLAKMDLPDENPLKQQLAYYWYLHGPTSDVVYSALGQMLASKTVSVRQGDYDLYTFSKDLHRRIADHDDSMSEMSLIIIKHVRSFTNMNSMVRDVYVRHSPFQFHISYKLDFKDRFEAFCRQVINLDDGARIHGTDILESFRDATLDLCEDKKFFDFEILYNEYSRALHILLDADLVADKRYKKSFELAGSLCDKIWTAFAHNARIHAHDQYYDKFVSNWKCECSKTMEKLQEDLREFSEAVSALHIPVKRLSKELGTIVDKIEREKTPVSEARPADEYLKTIDNLCK